MKNLIIIFVLISFNSYGQFKTIKETNNGFIIIDNWNLDIEYQQFNDLGNGNYNVIQFNPLNDQYNMENIKIDIPNEPLPINYYDSYDPYKLNNLDNKSYEPYKNSYDIIDNIRDKTDEQSNRMYELLRKKPN